MSKADEMFEELGYIIVKNDDIKIRYEDKGNEDLNLEFYKSYKVVSGLPTYDYFCDMNILQAIYEKCKELKWIN
jgi:hypothetical protein